ncbi:TPA: hypothetical protein HA242_01530 [Candidatus Woesearchaeota archaeon]|nr:hypothetical protein [Candidatus Woesearchaeota archaeon]
MPTGTLIKYNEKGDLVITIPKRIAKKYENRIIGGLLEGVVSAKKSKTAKWEGDSIRDIIGIYSSGIKDGSLKHDKYIYGNKK